MANTISKKVIVSNKGALVALYGKDKVKIVYSSIETLVGADQQKHIFLEGTQGMRLHFNR